MEPVEYLRALRRRRGVVLAAALVGVLAAWLTTQVAGVPVGSPQYEATATLIADDSLNPSSDYAPSGPNLSTLAELTTIGQIPVRVAKAIGFDGDPATLAATVRAEADEDTGILRITAVSTDVAEAPRLANAFANELIGFIQDSRQANVTQRAKSTRERMDQARKEIAGLDRQIASAGGSSQADVLRAERDAKVGNYSLLYEAYQQLATEVIAAPALQIVQEASAVPAVGRGFQPPRSLPSRMVFGGLLGLLAGIALALVLERLDVRIRTREAAEEHFGLPTLAEIPRLSRRRRKAGVAAASRPRSQFADSFRLLGLGVSPPARNGEGGAAPQTVMVTSPGPGDGKSTVVANLAAVYAELGKRVLVLSCDFHRPQVHHLLGVPNVGGLAEALVTGNGAEVLNGHVVDRTAVDRVSVVPSGNGGRHAAELFGSPRMRQALQEARAQADLVLIDTPPILAASDATHLIPDVDAVVVVARAGRTTADEAARCAELLKRFSAPVVGVALNAVTEGGGSRRYYYYGRRG